jgi:hypothetical protein
MEASEPDVAFYYPGWMWQDPGWVKSLALFFDEIGLLVPDYMRDRPHSVDPAVAAGLEEAGLLRILSPETLVDKEATEALATALVDVLAAGALDGLPDAGPFQELSWSRLGGYGDPGLAQMIYHELKERHLARQSEDGVSVPLHPVARSLVLVLLAQILRSAGPRLGVDLSPITDRADVHAALSQLLALPKATPGPGRVVSFDLEVVGPNLDPVPLDEVLAFRSEHGHEFRAYARGLRRTVRDLATVPEDEQQAVLDDRRDEIREQAEALRLGPLRTLGAVASVGLGIAGGTASAVAGDPVGGLLSAAAAATGVATATRAPTLTPYSYLFAIGRQFG